MKGEHCKDRLSGYLDGELSAEEKSGVEAHLEGCPGCAGELESLRRVSKAVGGLPEADLPDGFMGRLHRRRREEEAEAYKPKAWLPAPYRVAAFAAAGVMVCLVFFREVRYRFAPQMLPSPAAGDVLLAEAEKEAESMAREDGQAFRGIHAEPAEWRGLVDGERGKGPAREAARGMAAAKPGAGPSKEEIAAFRKMVLDQLTGRGGPLTAAASQAPPRAAGAKKKAVRAGGRPVEFNETAGPEFTNQDLQEFLQKERERIGIQKIMGEERPFDPWHQIPNRPMSRGEAQVAMRRFTAQLRQMNRGMNRQTTVPLGDGTTPRIIGSEDDSRPLAVGVAAPPASVMTTVAGGSGPRAPAVSGSESLAMVRRKAEEEAKKPPKRYPILKSWKGATGGLGYDAGALLKNEADWRDFWTRVRGSEPVPAVDFTKNMVVAVFAGKTETGYLEVGIESVVEQDDIIVVGFRLGTDPEKTGPSAPYHAVLIRRSPLQVRFEPLR